MKTIHLLVLVLMASIPLSSHAAENPRRAEWKAVDDAVNRGLPKTAITNLEPIIAGAMRDKAYAEAVKAIGKKITLEGTIEGNKPEEKITRLETVISTSPREMTPILETLLAHWYWQYFQQNKWRFMQRTATGSAPGKNFTTWDLPRLYAEIDVHFQKALTAEKVLKSTPIAAWDDLLVKGTMPDSERPTLYDFIAQESLEFYTSGEQAGAKAEGTFELSVDSPALESVENFIAWDIAKAANGDTNSPIVKAILTFQSLLRFHKTDSPPQLAFVAADLERLTWAWNAAFGEDKNKRYQTALNSFISTYADFEIMALACERAGQVMRADGELLAAHSLAERGAKVFPQSPGGKLCRNLLNELEAKFASINTERVWNCFEGSTTASSPGACPVIHVSYRNVTNVYFRAVAYDWNVFLEQRRNRPDNLNQQERREILAKTPSFEWSQLLTPTSDYREKSLNIPAPTSLKPGFYFICASHDPKFSETENVIYMGDVWVSDLALVTRTGTGSGNIEGFVLDAGSGEPIQSAEVSVWHLDNQGIRVADPGLTTDENGFFSMKPAATRGYLFRARKQGREVATVGDLWTFPWQNQPEVRQTVFFTDRALYRPGQTIQYKGICLQVNQTRDNYKVLKGEQLSVVFRDANNKEIARQKLRANDYGSFSGSFTAPRSGLMGQMTIQAEGRAEGATALRVEEYKRPKFEVALDAPKTAAKLNEKVNLVGHAMAYTGAAIDGASIDYRVVRQVRMPWWWGWYGGRWAQAQQSQEIAHGIAKTAADGSFKIEFTALPDLKVPEKDEPTFVYEIHSDVTDSAGETRSAERSVRVGYSALEAVLSVDDWQTEDKPVELGIKTTSLDDEPQVAEGSIKIYSLQAPEKVQRASLSGLEFSGYVPGPFPRRAGGSEEEQDLSAPNNWPLGGVVFERGFTTDTNGVAKISVKLTNAVYRAVLETQDRFGKKITGRLPIQVLKPDATKLAIKIPHLLASPNWETEPGQDFMALWGTGYEQGRAFIEIEHRHKLLQRFWTSPGQTQQQIRIAVTEAMRGGFTLHVTQVRENRAYLESRHIAVPWHNKELTLKWEHFTSKLQPGQKETWTLTIAKNPGTNSSSAAKRAETAKNAVNPGATVEKAVAELVAALYDESLDAFAPHSWLQRFNVFREDSSSLQPQFVNTAVALQHIFGGWPRPYENVSMTYRAFPPDLVQNRRGFFLQGASYYGGGAHGGGTGGERELTKSFTGSAVRAAAAPMVTLAGRAEAKSLAVEDGAVHFSPNGSVPQPQPKPGPQADLSKISTRKNLNETAFFFPQLLTDSNGVVRMTFTLPEALTKWRFLGFAHDASLRSGYLEDHVVTSKDLMVQPNPPRFLRENDTVEFTVKVSNQSGSAQSGTIRLTFIQALNDTSADKLLGNNKPEQSFTIPAKASSSFSWRITVPDGCGFLTYKAVAASSTVSDGEEGAVPVLSRRIFITESLPLPIRGPATKKFEFTKLLKSGSSHSLQNKGLTVQMVSNPAWYAVLALPYLMEYPHECSEQVFNRLYANALARNIASSDPKIHRVFEQWRNTPALDSPLEKNQDLKSVILEDTPWVRQAQNESQARRNVGILFDDNRLNYEMERTLQQLAQMQLADGSWPWFPGGRGNDYITLYITTGFGRLRHLAVDLDVSPAVRSIQRLDNWMNEEYRLIQKRPQPEKYVPSSTDALYLYGRSFFLKDQPIAGPNRTAIDFFLAQARKFWLQTDCRQTQGQLALALNRFNTFNSFSDPTPMAIMKSLKERSVSNDEMGMFWRDTELSWWWYRAPIETQALMIEAFDEVAHDAGAVEDCRVWLLKQKQTQDWKTTKATADAVYALLLRGRDILSSQALVEIKLDNIDLTPGKNQNEKSPKPQAAPEAGTGFYEVRFPAADVKPKLGEITVKKMDQGVAWGSVYWQYLEDMSKVTPYTGTPLKLKKSLYKKMNTSKGPTLEAVKSSLEVGDEVVVRIELKVDRDMEYVHLKDQRGSGTEPVNVLSQYRYQDGLAYYESTRDTASHFFIDYLPKGVYVFEYSTRVQLRGDYQTGVAQIECMYAPEFSSHSESIPLVVK
jgi:hypothetical protein